MRSSALTLTFGPLYLIHTNKVPNPITMRVPSVFEGRKMRSEFLGGCDGKKRRS